MIWHVQRRNGSIVATYSEPKQGLEALDDQTSPELQAYFNGARVDLSDPNNLEKALKAVLYAAGGMAGKTPADSRQAFRTAWQALP
jgi:hypothetical protein